MAAKKGARGGKSDFGEKASSTEKNKKKKSQRSLLEVKKITSTLSFCFSGHFL